MHRKARRIVAPVTAILIALSAVGHAQPPEHSRNEPLARIALGSCARQSDPQPIWDAVLATQPQLFILLGDNIYGDTQDMSVLRAKYDRFNTIAGFKNLRASTPLVATWDDHDYGANDAGADYPKKVESQQVFLDFLGEPADSPRRRREGVYNAYMYGPQGKRVQVILLDTRYFRSPLKERPKAERKAGEGPYAPNEDRRATILGDAQWKWLAEQLGQPAEVRLIGSSIQVVAEDQSFERWGEMPRERGRLFKTIREAKAGGVIFLSGDRHFAELSMTDAGLGYPLFDLTSSSLNRSVLNWRYAEPNRHRVHAMPWGNNFGLVTIDWDRPDPLISLQVRDTEGDVAFQTKIPLSALQPGTEATKPAGGH